MIIARYGLSLFKVLGAPRAAKQCRHLGFLWKHPIEREPAALERRARSVPSARSHSSAILRRTFPAVADCAVDSAEPCRAGLVAKRR